MRFAKFSVTGTYGNQPAGEDDVYTIAEFTALCKSGAFIDDDGDGEPVCPDRSIMDMYVCPSQLEDIPKEATHIIWYNK